MDGSRSIWSTTTSRLGHLRLLPQSGDTGPMRAACGHSAVVAGASSSGGRACAAHGRASCWSDRRAGCLRRQGARGAGRSARSRWRSGGCGCCAAGQRQGAAGGGGGGRTCRARGRGCAGAPQTRPAALARRCWGRSCSGPRAPSGRRPTPAQWQRRALSRVAGALRAGRARSPGAACAAGAAAGRAAAHLAPGVLCDHLALLAGRHKGAELVQQPEAAAQHQLPRHHRHVGLRGSGRQASAAAGLAAAAAAAGSCASACAGQARRPAPLAAPWPHPPARCACRCRGTGRR